MIYRHMRFISLSTMTGSFPIIRPARIDDLGQIAEIESEAFERGWTRENLRKEFEASFSLMLVAEAGNKIVGFITAWKITGEIQINRLAVTASYRRRGIARRLIETLIDRCSMNPPYKILLEVREKNIAARALYRSLGFSENGLRKNYYRDDNAILLGKEIGQ